MRQETTPPATPTHQPTTPEPISPTPLKPKYTEPLYTEIRIPLPPIPQPPSTLTPPKSRHRAHSLSSLSPFHRRRDSSPSEGKEQGKEGREGGEGRAKEMMKGLMKGRSRNNTVDALAVVPAVLVLSAELFTPEERGKRIRDGKGEDGAVK